MTSTLSLSIQSASHPSQLESIAITGDATMSQTSASLQDVANIATTAVGEGLKGIRHYVWPFKRTEL